MEEEKTIDIIQKIYGDEVKRQEFLDIYEKIKDCLVISGDGYKRNPMKRKLYFIHLLQLEGILGKTIEVIREIEKKPKCSEEQLQYAKQYRLFQKELKEKEDRRLRVKTKMESACKERRAFCYKCRKIQLISGFKPELKRKPNRTRVLIHLTGKCPSCDGKMGAFAGYLSEEDSKSVEFN